MSNSPILQALDQVKSGNFVVGPQLDAAHCICQAHEGQMIFDWLHALIHRIEGDESNSRYWYRRAGQRGYPGSFSDEWDIIRKAVTN